MALKVDMEKSCDKDEWSFLLRVINLHGLVLVSIPLSFSSSWMAPLMVNLLRTVELDREIRSPLPYSQ